MIWHLFQSGVEDDILNLFEEHKEKVYQSKKGIHRLLNTLGLKAKKLRQQCIEGALVGFIQSTVLKTGQLLISDRARQFALFDHAACWVHMERPLRKIICTSERDIRSVAKRRNISGSTKSEMGRKFRDGLQTLKQTCFRLGYNFWDYMQRWFRGDPPDIAELVRKRYQPSSC